MIVGNELGQRVGTIRHEITRLNEVGAKLLDVLPVHRVACLMGKHFEEIGRRAVQGYFESRVVDRLDAERIGGCLGGGIIDFLGAFDRIQHSGIFCSGFGIKEPPEGINEIMGGHGIAIRPHTVGAQLEGINLAVAGNGPAFSRAGNKLGLGILHDETLKQVAQDVGFIDGGCLVGIE